ncbi:MAG: transglutaminase domain-containing protein [Candidatus Hadarchaeales archaeon]
MKFHALGKSWPAFVLAMVIILSQLHFAGGSGFEYTILKEIRAEVLDSETGMRVDNFLMEGEIHSTAIYFRIEFSSGVYSYWIWDENMELIRSAEGLQASGSDPWQVVLPVSDLLDNGEHFFQLTVYSPGYSTLHMSGSFYGDEHPFLSLRLERLSPGSLSICLADNEVTVVRRFERFVGEVERMERYPEPIPAESASSRVMEIESRGHTPVYENRTVTEQTGWKKIVELESSAAAGSYSAGGYRVTTETSYQRCEVVVGYNVTVEVEEWVRDPSGDYHASNVSSSTYDSWQTGWVGPNGDYKYWYYRSSYCTLTGYNLYLYVEDWGGLSKYYESKWVSLSEYNEKWADGGDSDGLWFGYKWVRSATPTYSNYIGYYRYLRKWRQTGQKYVTVQEYSSPPSGTRYVNPVPVKENRYTSVTRWAVWEPVYSTVTREYLIGERWRERTSEDRWVSEPEVVEVPVYISAGGYDGPVSLSVSGAPAWLNAWFEPQTVLLSSERGRSVLRMTCRDNWSIGEGSHIMRVWASGGGRSAFERLALNIDVQAGVEITRIYPLNVGRRYDSAFGGEAAYAYYVGQSPAFRVTAANFPGFRLISSAAVMQGGRTLMTSEVYGGDNFTHTFSGRLESIGEYELRVSVSDASSGMVFDATSYRFYAVFPAENDVAEWHYSATTTFHDGFWSSTALHPFSKEILEFVFSREYASNDPDGRLKPNPVSGQRERISTAEALAHLIGDYIYYDSKNCDHWDDLTILNLNGLNPAGRPAGDCSDFTSAYISCARALGLPVRYMLIPNIHAFNELCIDGEWIHVEPQGTFNDADIYLRQGWIGNVCIEISPANVNVLASDRMATLKYMVGISDWTVTVNVDGNGNGESILNMVNKAPFGTFDGTYYIVQDFRVEVIDTGGIPEVEVVGLPSRLAPGESAQARLRVRGAASSHDYTVRLKLSYRTADEKVCEKISALIIST